MSEYKKFLLILFAGISALLLFSYLKNPYLFPGLEQRVFWLWLPITIIYLVALLPMSKIAKSLIRVRRLKPLSILIGKAVFKRTQDIVVFGFGLLVIILLFDPIFIEGSTPYYLVILTFLVGVFLQPSKKKVRV